MRKDRFGRRIVEEPEYERPFGMEPDDVPAEESEDFGVPVNIGDPEWIMGEKEKDEFPGIEQYAAKMSGRVTVRKLSPEELDHYRRLVSNSQAK